MKLKKTTEQIVSEFKQTHGSRYDYSKVNYQGSSTKVKIMCEIHGEFSQFITHHRNGCGCPKCASNQTNQQNTQPTEDFVNTATLKFGDRFSYYTEEYINLKTPIHIHCPEHGVYITTPKAHLNSAFGCPQCSVKLKKQGRGVKSENTSFLKDYFEKVTEFHKGKYDYSKAKYIAHNTKIEIICPVHGSFFQTPNNHTKCGCWKCSTEERIKGLLKTQEEFLAQAIELHKGYYDYSKIRYQSCSTPVEIICPVHGSFFQKPAIHLIGCGCPKCKIVKTSRARNLGKDEFIARSKEIHGEKYNYEKVSYVKAKIPVIIICPKHGEFLQKPAKHLIGCGCQKCKESRGEKQVRIFLEQHKIEYVPQKSFPECKDINLLRYDFYLPKQNILIEFDGEQHFKQAEHFNRTLEDTQRKDKIKTDFAKANNIQLIRIGYKQINQVHDILRQKVEGA